MMTSTPIKILAWLALATIIFVTVSPIGLRPHDYLSVNLDRALAFALATFLFVLAYPRHFAQVAIALIIGALAIEALQLLSPTRHPQIIDATVKAGGAAAGAVTGWLLLTVLSRRKQAIKAPS